MDHITGRLEIKSQEPGEGKFSGYANVYGVQDLNGDIVKPGAFTRSIKNRDVVPILLEHETKTAVGLGRLTEKPKGLWVDAVLNLGIDAAKSAQQLITPIAEFGRGVIDGLSIGFVTMRDALGEKAREILEAKVLEVSLVAYPANESSRVVKVKSARQMQDELQDLERRINLICKALIDSGIEADPDIVHSAYKSFDNDPAEGHSLSQLLAYLQTELRGMRGNEH